MGCDQAGLYWRLHIPGRWSHLYCLRQAAACLGDTPSSSCLCVPPCPHLPSGLALDLHIPPMPAFTLAGPCTSFSCGAARGCWDVSLCSSPFLHSSPSCWSGTGIGAFLEAQSYSEYSCHHARVTRFLSGQVVSEACGHIYAERGNTGSKCTSSCLNRNSPYSKRVHSRGIPDPFAIL